MADATLIIENNEQFLHHFSSLDHRSIVRCRLRLAPGEEHLLVDLQQRGVTLIPSSTSQLSSRSKVHQARIFSRYMLPETLVVYNIRGLLEATSHYNRQKIREVVVKQDRKNGGMGVHRFGDIEDVYNQAAWGGLKFPIVIQPRISKFSDIRIICIGDYIEGYQRYNPDNFRHNLHCGGKAVPWQIDERLIRLCREVMERGNFPFAFIDLMLTPDDNIYLTEINLRGGLRGARLDTVTFKEKSEVVLSRLTDQAVSAIQMRKK